MNRYDQEETTTAELIVKDSLGNVLQKGDDAFLTQDLPVKGMKPFKRGAVLKNIRLRSTDEDVEGKIDGTTMVVKTCYLKKKG